MATVRARALSFRVLLVLALCLAASAAKQQQPTNRYISYAGLPRTRGGNGAGAPRGNGRSVLRRCSKSCHGQPPTKAAAETAAAAESEVTDISYAAATMTGAKMAATGSTGAYISLAAALSEEKRRYISNAALKHDRPRDICPLPLPSCA